MILLEQLVYGIDPDNPQAGRTLLGSSPGMGGDVALEIQRYCDGWGQVPELGLRHPALLSCPLAGSMPSLRGRLHVVIRVGSGLQPTFHAAVLNEAAYAQFGFNPFRFLQTGFFPAGWQSGDSLAQRQTEVAADQETAGPDPVPEDEGVVDEAVHKLLLDQKLEIPLEQAGYQSDRALDLMIGALPATLRRNLRFASFATSDVNDFTLSVRETSNSTLAGWRRWFLSQAAPPLEGELDDYIQAVREGLKSGEGDLLREAARILDEKGSVRVRPARPGAPSTPASASEATPRPVEAFRPSHLVPDPEPISAARTLPAAGALRTPLVNRGPLPAAVPGTLGQGAFPPRDVPSLRTRRARLVRQPIRVRHAANRRVSGLLSVMLILAAASGTAYWWLSHGGLEDGWDWVAGLSRSSIADDERGPSLLGVVDVGEVYSRQLRKNAQSGFGLPGTRDRSEAEELAALREEAAQPLLHQIVLFRKLAAEGIQQGSRPDRETDRLRALARQGGVLEQEVARLELAWHSLAAGVRWVDLGGLPDHQVAARRDSLARVPGGALSGASRELGTLTVRRPLQSARRQVDGMVSLLELFQAGSWSPEWEGRLYRAAEKISPSATAMTRAYRNAAFSIVRLKRAERSSASLARPFTTDLPAGAWPARAVRDVLPSLRRQAGLFAQGEAPDLLAGMIRMYAALEDPQALVAAAELDPDLLSDLQRNPAAIFDPASYADFLDRIRFEAVDLLLADGAREEDVPDSYFLAEDRAADRRFRELRRTGSDPQEWERFAAEAGPSFLVRWARAEGERVRTQQRRGVKDFDRAYGECLSLRRSMAASARSGADWSRWWWALRDRIATALAAGGSLPKTDALRGERKRRLEELNADLVGTRKLDVESVTVRLDEGVLTGPANVVLEFQVQPEGEILRSEPFPLGPAAPAETGWVGTGGLDWVVAAGPDSGFSGRILHAETGATLLTVDWRSLASREGPGVLIRPREGEGGSLGFRLGPAWFRDLALGGQGADPSGPDLD